MYQNLEKLADRKPIAVARIVATGKVVAWKFAGCNVRGVGYVPYIDGEAYLRLLDEEGEAYEWVSL